MDFKELHNYQAIKGRTQQLEDSFKDYNEYLTKPEDHDFTNPHTLALFNASLQTFSSLATAITNFGKKNNELVSTVSR